LFRLPIAFHPFKLETEFLPVEINLARARVARTSTNPKIHDSPKFYDLEVREFTAR
jgi:hypothetical protein